MSFENNTDISMHFVGTLFTNIVCYMASASEDVDSDGEFNFENIHIYIYIFTV